jgi:predicted transposase/invertase (TIGR01784 family)
MYAEAREKAIRDEKAALRTAMREGREEGLEQGREEGERNKSIAIARNLKAQNISVEIIAASTGLSAAEIESL